MARLLPFTANNDLSPVICLELMKTSLPRMSTRRSPTQHNPFHCVTIEGSAGACKAVMALSGQRFLSKDAPDLPLRACNVDLCECRYVHYDDRRHDVRRSADIGLPGVPRGGTDQRVRTDRRDASTPSREVGVQVPAARDRRQMPHAVAWVRKLLSIFGRSPRHHTFTR